MPPFGLVRFLEAVGVSSVQPGLISPASLLDTIEEGRAIGADALEHLLADGFDLAADYVFVDSWFESGGEVDAVLVGNRQAPNKRAALIMRRCSNRIEERAVNLLLCHSILCPRIAHTDAVLEHQTAEDILALI